MNKEAKILLGLGVVTVLALFGGVFLFSKPNTPESQSAATPNPEILIRENSSFRGSKEAKVKIVEFADFQCPACAGSHPATEEVVKQYGDKIQFVFRHFPLDQHKNALKAAISAEAAAKQGKFWEMGDKLFRSQDEWFELSNPSAKFEEYAKGIGLDIKKYNEDLKDKSLEEKIKSDLVDGIALGVSSTPSFFINGKKSGYLSTEGWQRVIDSELQK